MRFPYAGLERDISDRFAQHTGLVGFPDNSRKRVQIEKWFGTHDRLGVSIAVQWAEAQVNTRREQARLRKDFDEEDPAGFASNRTTDTRRSRSSRARSSSRTV